MRIKYTNYKFNSNQALILIDQCSEIIAEYQKDGYDLTIRQLYYQIVARDLFPNDRRWTWNGKKWQKNLDNGTKNAKPNYTWLSTTLSKARDSGLIDWYAIVDRTRKAQSQSTWNNLNDILSACHQQYRLDKWENQSYRPFVWIEKEALAGVVERACYDDDIQCVYISCRGYMSASAIWKEAQKLAKVANEKQLPVIFHLGDHDPSGLDMTRDNIKRLELYSRLSCISLDIDKVINGCNFSFERIALNYNQILKYNPPSNYAKLTDPRVSSYIERYGTQSWELDALNPDILVELIKSNINQLKNYDLWDKLVDQEQKHKDKLQNIIDNL